MRMMEPKLIRRVIREEIKSRGPLKRDEIARAFDPNKVTRQEIDKTINKLVSLQILFPYAGDRLWDQNDESFLKDEAKRLIRKRPRSRMSLATSLCALHPGVSATEVKTKLFDALQDDPDVHLQLTRDGRTFVLSVEKPDFQRLVKPLATKFQKVSSVLEKAGYPMHEIQTAVVGGNLAPGLSSPGEEVDIDFQRDTCELLVYAWQDSSCAETRESLKTIMLNLGLEMVETPGAQTEFNGLMHHSESSVSRGDIVRVLHPGWKLNNSRGNYLIAKAEVETVSQ